MASDAHIRQCVLESKRNRINKHLFYEIYLSIRKSLKTGVRRTVILPRFFETTVRAGVALFPLKRDFAVER